LFSFYGKGKFKTEDLLLKNLEYFRLQNLVIQNRYFLKILCKSYLKSFLVTKPWFKLFKILQNDTKKSYKKVKKCP
jgi:hypothetical protein